MGVDICVGTLDSGHIMCVAADTYAEIFSAQDADHGAPISNCGVVPRSRSRSQNLWNCVAVTDRVKATDDGFEESPVNIGLQECRLLRFGRVKSSFLQPVRLYVQHMVHSPSLVIY